jgi:hypothetical protein
MKWKTFVTNSYVKIRSWRLCGDIPNKFDTLVDDAAEKPSENGGTSITNDKKERNPRDSNAHNTVFLGSSIL